MSTNVKDGLDYILQAISNLIEPKLDKLRYDRTYRAKVISIVSDKLYEVQIKNAKYNVSYDGTLEVGDVVRVKAPLNNFSDIYIEGSPTVVSSTDISLIDEYSINEQNTDKKWIDGREIYNKVITGTKTQEDLEINIGEDIDEIFVISAKMTNTKGYVLPFYVDQDNFVNIETNGNNIIIKGGSSENSQGTITIIIEYIKQIKEGE